MLEGALKVRAESQASVVRVLDVRDSTCLQSNPSCFKELNLKDSSGNQMSKLDSIVSLQPVKA